MGAKPAAKPAGPPPLPLHEVPEVAIKIVRRSGPACRGSDTEDITRAVTASDTGDVVWPGVPPETISLQLVNETVEVRSAAFLLQVQRQ
jgi:hypothetical protein